jgi:hypothetical protein
MAEACSCELQMARDALFRAQRLVEVHGAAAGDEEAVGNAEVGNEFEDVVGKFHRFLRITNLCAD